MTRFMLPAMGSTMMHAMRSPSARNAASTAARSLNGSTMVSLAMAGGTPADDGVPNVSAPGARLHEQAVAVSVVAAFELDDLAAPRVTAGEPQRGHRGLGARRDQADEFHRRHEAAKRLRHLDLHLRRGAERQAVRRRFPDGVDDRRMRVAEDRRPPRSDIVEIALAVGVPQVRAVAARDEAWRAADGTIRAHRRIDACGDRALRAREELFVAIHDGFA